MNLDPVSDFCSHVTAEAEPARLASVRSAGIDSGTSVKRAGRGGVGMRRESVPATNSIASSARLTGPSLTSGVKSQRIAQSLERLAGLGVPGFGEKGITDERRSLPDLRPAVRAPIRRLPAQRLCSIGFDLALP
jgi:hypothetical protein